MKTLLLPLLAVLSVTAAKAADFPPLLKGVASHGAVACDGYLYLYGGHCGKTHTYDTSCVLGTFHRLKLDGGTKWEELAGGPILQGMNLATHGGKVYRVGGMTPRNEPGAATDNISSTAAAAYDPKTGKWESLPDLPAGRSSHDVVVAGSKLVVVGGWEQKGKGEKAVWHDTAVTLDLSVKGAKWESVPQPFKRRALTAAAVGTKVYVFGGLGEKGGDRRTDVLDVSTGKWGDGPKVPGDDKVAFSPAAAVLNGRVILNTSTGQVYRMTETADGWEKVAEADVARHVARLVPFGEKVILLGGAGGNGNVTEVETIKLAAKGEPVAESK